MPTTGETLARIASASLDLTDRYDPPNLERLWPRAEFDRVVARGVAYRTEEYDQLSDLEAAHPGSVRRSLMFFGQTGSRVLW